MSMIDTAYAERLAEETKAMELKAFLQKIADDERAMAEKAAQEQRNEEELRELDKRIDMEVAAATSIALAAYAASTATAVTTNNEQTAETEKRLQSWHSIFQVKSVRWKEKSLRTKSVL